MTVTYHNSNTGHVVHRDQPSPRLEALPNWVRVEAGDPAPTQVDHGALARQSSAAAAESGPTSEAEAPEGRRVRGRAASKEA